MLALLLAELVSAVLLIGRPAATPAPVLAIPAATVEAPAASGSTTITLPDGRTADLVSLGGADSDALLRRIAAELGDAAATVSEFWGTQWRRDITVVATGSDAQFSALAGGGADIAAATTVDRILFAPGAAAMNPDDLRIVLRHELFHFAAREATAADAPRWLTEGVADYVARPRTAAPARDQLTALPTDADLDTAGQTRSSAYDRAWWFATYVADRYGREALRALYERACGPGHPDVATAVRETLGADLDDVVAGWTGRQAG
ncbi:peptidase [Mycolicibacterium sp. S2-37]|nr:basic secretory protein-like protein [Mycolicibacterium sp. S2-37]MBO0680527.1 peptidase [Mycolicibacterium sp. S2-37]